MRGGSLKAPRKICAQCRHYNSDVPGFPMCTRREVKPEVTRTKSIITGDVQEFKVGGRLPELCEFERQRGFWSNLFGLNKCGPEGKYFEERIQRPQRSIPRHFTTIPPHWPVMIEDHLRDMGCRLRKERAVLIDILPHRCYNLQYMVFTEDNWCARLEFDECDPEGTDVDRVVQKLFELINSRDKKP